MPTVKNGGVRPGARDSTLVVHRQLRDAILTGDVAPGAWLSQVQVAKEYGVSRGPVREALRLLEREGLIESAVNQRARVTAFSSEDLEQLYAVRILNEAFALSVSVPRFSRDDLEGLQLSLDTLDLLAGNDVDKWEVEHRRFHRALIAGSDTRLRRMIEQFHDHSERYRRAYITGDPRAWSVGAAEHREIVDACVAGDAQLAAGLLARHLSRTALTVLLSMAPEHDPALVRAAVRQFTANLPTLPNAFGRA